MTRTEAESLLATLVRISQHIHDALGILDQATLQLNHYIVDQANIPISCTDPDDYL